MKQIIWNFTSLCYFLRKIFFYKISILVGSLIIVQVITEELYFALLDNGFVKNIFFLTKCWMSILRVGPTFSGHWDELGWIRLKEVNFHFTSREYNPRFFAICVAEFFSHVNLAGIVWLVHSNYLIIKQKGMGLVLPNLHGLEKRNSTLEQE